MRTTRMRGWRAEFIGVAVLAVAAIMLTACGADDDASLSIGVVLPETGALGISNVPAIAAVELAEEDIRAADGEVEFQYADSGSDPTTAAAAVDALLDAGADAILGAAASGVSQAFIGALYEAEAAQCAFSNTSPSFTGQANAAYYFRTVSSDTAVVHLMEETILAGGAGRVSILARDDDYGRSLAGLLTAALTERGSAADAVIFDPLKPAFDEEVAAVARHEPDVLVLIAFEEGVLLLRELLDAGFDPDMIYGTDGVYLPDLPGAVDQADPGVLDDMTLFLANAPKSTAAADLGERLRAAGVDDPGSPWAGRAYDCAVILALAARAAGTSDGGPLFAAALEVTNDGVACYSYAECARRIDNGEDVAYAGAAGPLRLDDAGDPTVASYAISRYEGGALVEQSQATFDLAR